MSRPPTRSISIARSRVDRFDANKNGQLTSDEFSSFQPNFLNSAATPASSVQGITTGPVSFAKVSTKQPLEGFSASKLADLSHNSLKYRFGRVAQNYSLSSVTDKESAEAVLNAWSAIERRDLVAKRAAMSRALAVLAELQSTLNMSDGGDVAKSLDGLYTYMNGRLLDGSMKNDVAPLDETLKLAGTLREAGAEIAGRGAAEPLASQARP